MVEKRGIRAIEALVIWCLVTLVFAGIVWYFQEPLKELKKKPKDPYKLMLEDKKIVDFGFQVFTKNCSQCHGEKGEGFVGPDLTDDEWIIASGNVKSIISAISKGSVKNGMPAWGEKISPEEIEAVAVFIRSQKGYSKTLQPTDSPEGDD